ncbi:metal ABC transporter substrate-binding protein [Oceanimonas sp. MB9]|uniref:metal ABC transporter substrate-binding protein n=1 Tax=Oceanimonas sp. MB9 TaxID=2588453 RepID=UPI0013F6308C|nr:metal ABC transporter substrate-binding protein [Oceanimonas sp. MB9]NHI01842.1 putative metal ABC transporter substrate-binding protein Hpf [Oceanimonas sp. MB9]
MVSTGFNNTAAFCRALYLPVLGLILMLSLSGQGQAASADKMDKLRVITTFTVIADMAANVAGDAAIVESITKPGAEIHDYQPTPQDIVKAQSANLILWNGMNLERWFERFLQNVKDVPSAVITNGVSPLSIYEGPYNGKPNPHAWMSTANAQIYIENIRDALIRSDPANADTYHQNAADYAARIRRLGDTLRQQLTSIPRSRRWLVTSEGAFSYLAQDLGLREVYLWPINADQQGTPQQVRKVIDTVRANRIPVVFSESTVSDRPARQVAKEAGASYGGVLYVDSLSGPRGPVPSYYELLRLTTQTIVNGFKAQ